MTVDRAKTAIADARAETLAVASEFGTEVDLVVAAAPLRPSTPETGEGATPAARAAALSGARSTTTEGAHT